MTANGPPPRPLVSWYQLVGLTFFAVCGGDYGIEDTVGAAGARLTLLGLLLLPWVWSLPIALMTAELSAMIPEAGGYVVWVHRAFGPFWAHHNAMWNLVSNAFDNALYPVMFVDYLHYFPAFRRLAFVKRWLLSLSMLASVTGLNLLGVDVVASASTIFAALVISPFGALVVAGLPSLDPSAWMTPSEKPIKWGTFLSVLLWNTSGYDSVGALASEVKRPGRDFPRAMIATILLVTLVYVLPLSVAISLDSSQLSKWTDGHFTRVAQEHVRGHTPLEPARSFTPCAFGGPADACLRHPASEESMPPLVLLPCLLSLTASRVCRCAAAEQVGDWLSAWISLGGALSAVGLLNTLLCTAARVCVSAARIKVLPSCLAKLDDRGLPRRATLAISVVLAFACALPFSELVSISMLFYGVTTAIEFLALVKLRYSEAQTPRPFRIPIGRWWLPLACAPPILLCMLLVALAPVEAWVAFLFATVRAPTCAPVTLHSVLARTPRSGAGSGPRCVTCWWH